jgi:hypothetical protein
MTMLRRDKAREGNQKLEWWLTCSLNRNEYRNLKLVQTTMGRGLWRSEEDW